MDFNEFPLDITVKKECVTCQYLDTRDAGDPDEFRDYIGKCHYYPDQISKYKGGWCSKYFPNEAAVDKLRTEAKGKLEELKAAMVPGDDTVVN